MNTYTLIADTIAIALIVVFALDIALLFLFGLHSYIMVLLYRNRNQYCDSGTDVEYPPIRLKGARSAGIPIVTVQLPIYNEYYVVDRLIECAVNMEWPRNKLEIQVLDDSTDETYLKIQQLVKGYRRKGFNIHHLHRTNRKGHKAGALKEGLTLAKGDFVAVFDADFMPARDFLIKCMPYFRDPEIGMVQSRWGHINADYSVLTRAQSVGIDGHFVIEQVARNANELWMNFNGTGGIWRKQCILDAGDWQSDTLTEDFDLSYRAELAGWKFRYFKDVVNPAEIPATVHAFKSQQFRWCKGSLQTAMKLIPRIWKSGFNWKIKTEALIHLLNYSVHPLMILNILLLLPVLTMHSWSSYDLRDVSLVSLFTVATFLSLGTFGPLVFYTYSQRELYPDWKTRILYLPVLMMIGTGIAVVNTRAYLEAILGIQSSFKRTPKLRIESRSDVIQSRNRYRLPLDPLVILEIFMGLYCLVCVYQSFVIERVFLVPFLLIYAAGFLYIGLGSLKEAYDNMRMRNAELVLNNG